MTTRSSTTDSIKYSPIVDSFPTDDHKMEDGLTPVDTAHAASGKLSTGYSFSSRGHATSMDTVTQTANGSVVTLPRLHIPGETGELAGLSSELERHDSADGAIAAMVGPEKLKQVYSQVS